MYLPPEPQIMLPCMLCPSQICVKSNRTKSALRAGIFINRPLLTVWQTPSRPGSWCRMTGRWLSNKAYWHGQGSAASSATDPGKLKVARNRLHLKSWITSARSDTVTSQHIYNSYTQAPRFFRWVRYHSMSVKIYKQDTHFTYVCSDIIS